MNLSAGPAASRRVSDPNGGLVKDAGEVKRPCRGMVCQSGEAGATEVGSLTIKKKQGMTVGS